MVGIWFGLAAAAFMTVAFIGGGVVPALVVFGLACCTGLLYEVSK